MSDSPNPTIDQIIQNREPVSILRMEMETYRHTGMSGRVLDMAKELCDLYEADLKRCEKELKQVYGYRK